METLADLRGTQWTGQAELWLDPLGDQVEKSDCSIQVVEDGVRYTWSREGKSHEGRLVVRGSVVEFTDSWHQPEPMQCASLSGQWGLLRAEGRYGPDADWGWRTTLSLRAPTGELILQMTNVAPWGEEARAVRMVCAKDGDRNER